MPGSRLGQALRNRAGTAHHTALQHSLRFMQKRNHLVRRQFKRLGKLAMIGKYTCVVFFVPLFVFIQRYGFFNVLCRLVYLLFVIAQVAQFVVSCCYLGAGFGKFLKKYTCLPVVVVHLGL